MRRLLLPCLLSALAACEGRAPTGDASAPSASAQTASPAPVSSSAAQAPSLALPTREGGMIARSPSEDALYVADEDHGVVRRIALPFNPEGPVVTVAMPGLPAQVLALGDRVLVTIRSEGQKPPTAVPAEELKKPGKKPSQIPTSPTGPGLLLVMKPDAQKGLVEVGRATLPGDAWGIALTPDAKTALVSSAWTHKVSAIDLGSMKLRWTLDVRREPRAIVVRPDGQSAYVTHLVGGMITRLDDLGKAPRATEITLPPSPLRAPSGKTLDGTLAYSAALSPDGKRLFVARHAIGALGEAAWYGAATVDVMLTHDDSPLAPKRDANLPSTSASLLTQMMPMVSDSTTSFPRVSFTPFAEPRATVYRKRTSTLLVASEGTNRVVELDARTVDPTMFVKRSIDVSEGRDKLIPVATSGGAPSGIALSADESLAWVFCRATDDVVEIKLDTPPPPDGRKPRPEKPRRIRLGDDLLNEHDAKGRRIFYDATDSITSGGISCAGCHPEGRDDGHVWHEIKLQTKRSGEGTNFLGDGDQAPLEKTKKVGYARQTPMLAGRVSAAGPYGWHAESADLTARLIGGFKLHRWGGLSLTYGEAELLGRAQYLAPFLRHGLVPPPRAVHPETPEEARGKEIFKSSAAGCARCHVPEAEYTDRVAYRFSPPAPTPAGFEEEPDERYKTPSLFYVEGTPPYFHDGRASTLESLVEHNGDRMGKTGHLSPADRAALVAFLRTL
jgi:DNA-binding beta-propeller fold protein YncE/mono/diheme cytochrome c family protein